MSHSDFKIYMQSELVRRCKKNPRYSIRAFAKALGMDASTLAKHLNGKRPFGKQTIEKLGKKLGLSPSELAPFLNPESFGESCEDSYEQMNLDLFNIISDWYHFAILELMTIESFSANNKWIAKTLGITLSEATDAVDRLVRCGLLEIQKDQWLDRSSGRTTNIAPDLTTVAMRHLQKQFLQKAMTALDEVSISQRDNTSISMAIDIDKLPGAKEKIKNFRRSLAKFLSRSGKRNDVYNLTISLYPLTSLERK